MDQPGDEQMDKQTVQQAMWRRCADFHGHVCGGLTIGYKAVLRVMELLELYFSPDEEVVCITENAACGADTIQVLLACNVVMGNLMFHITGKNAYSFYNRTTGQSVRLVLKPLPEGMTREQSFDYLTNAQPDALFDVKPATIPLPERARIFDSYPCDACGETAGANWIRIQDGRKLCLDCAVRYDRFRV